MKTITSRILLLVGLLAGLAIATGCTVHTTPSSMSIAPSSRPAPTVLVSNPPPARVYHSGRWLHYRNDGYYYHARSSWVRAGSVPVHVRRYHRPAHVRTAPTHVRRTVAPSRTHHSRTVTNRRTYIRR